MLNSFALQIQGLEKGRSEHGRESIILCWIALIPGSVIIEKVQNMPRKLVH